MSKVMIFNLVSIRIRILRFLILTIMVINARMFVTYLSEKFIIFIMIFFAFKSICTPYYIEKFFLAYFKEYEKADIFIKYISVISVYVIFIFLEWIVMYKIFAQSNMLIV